jgi:hypothetical protein
MAKLKRSSSLQQGKAVEQILCWIELFDRSKGSSTGSAH